ncbi:MAG: GrpB family protein [Patescibacteria group bacterium]|nr:GrpB family protein [Patescibacteria group bacterium]
MKTRIETVIDPTTEILLLQEKMVGEVSDLLPMSHVEIVGSMAVPMAGRPELDILVISDDIAADSDILSKNGYKQGPIVKETSFLKKMVDNVEVAVQIMSADNKMVGIHRELINKLRNDEELRKRYEEFKRTLSGLSREEYKKQKSQWLEENIFSIEK